MNADEMIKEYGYCRLVAFFKDETEFWNNSGGLVDFAEGIHNCYITTLGEFLRWYNPTCKSAGYRMTCEYDYDTAEDEGNYHDREEEIRDAWLQDDLYVENIFRNEKFFILPDSWQISKHLMEEILDELQRDYSHVGYMKPNRIGNWDDGLTKADRKQSILWRFFEMSVCYADWTCNGTIPDLFSYDKERGWYGWDDTKGYQNIKDKFNEDWQEVA